jgi:uncharacterized protein YbbC (DUF1343 family)/CubicO group peptidase (beta-lactamase class C family)
MNSFCKSLLIFVLCLLAEILSVTTALTGTLVNSSRLIHEEHLKYIDDVVEKAIREHETPGAVILIGTNNKVLYRKAFGYRELIPEKLPMTVDTIFDLSSLTKVIATTTAVMQLVEKGKLRLDDPVTKYWPEFKSKGKNRIKVRDLLTHFSGLKPDLNMNKKWSGYKTTLRKVLKEKPIYPPRTHFVYSDINFIVLGEIVRRISGKPLDIYCNRYIFKPLGMKDTGFNPSLSLRDRIAPTQYNYQCKENIWGKVHDPIAERMGGVAGHAGLFSTADDISIFAQMILNKGSYKNIHILSPHIVEEMTKPQTPHNQKILRGLGWDIDSPFSSNRGELFPVGSFGHTGFTGTSIWIDPVSKIYIIILTNAVHPNGKGNLIAFRSEIATIVASALGYIPAYQTADTDRSMTNYHGEMKSYQKQELRNGMVKTGIDVLKEEKFKALSGLRVGIITNHSGISSSGERTIDLLYKAPGVKLVAIFSPEHGLSGKEDKQTSFSSTHDTKTGLRVYSLYKRVNRPTDKMLRGLDALIFDIQDAGVRFYTYITTMAYAMETASKKKIAFYVLDRPNPINASVVQGPIMDKDLKSFTGYFPLPVRHGMTVGELAQMFNKENKIGVDLHIIKMSGYERTDWYDDTGLKWVNPSPNLRTLTQAILYPGVALVEGANVSVGRGTDSPFELLGSPWINAEELSMYLNKRKIQGVRFMPADFIPTGSLFKNEVCHGVQIILTDRETLDPTALGIEIISAIHKLFPKYFHLDKTLDIIKSRRILQAIKEDQDPSAIVASWENQLEQFRRMRSKYLLY